MNIYLLEERGLFWWTDTKLEIGQIAPDSGVYGTLTIDDDGKIALALDNVMPLDTPYLNAFVSNEYTITRCISGILKISRKHVILNNIWRSGSTRSSNALSHDTYGAWTCLVSQHALNRSGSIPKFRNMTIALDGYEEWMGFGAIVVKTTRDQVIIKRNKRGTDVFRLNGKTIRLRYGVDGPRDSYLAREVSYKTFGAFDFSFRKSQSIDDILRHHRSYEDLLIVLSNFERDLAWPVVSISRRSNRATIYFRRTKRSDEEVMQLRCWTVLPNIIQSFEMILRRWEEKTSVLGAGIFMYTGTRRGLKLFLENEFTNLVVGLEALDRSTRIRILDTKHEEKITRILNAVPLEYRTWLRGRLKRSSDPNLQTRLISVLSELPLGIPKRRLAAFAKICETFRNKIAHEGGFSNSNEQASLMSDINRLLPALKALYHVRVLQEIGLENAAIKHLFTQSFEALNLNIALFVAGLLDEDPREKSIENSRRLLLEHGKILDGKKQ